MQSIVGVLLYYSQAVDIKLLVALSKLGHQQASATKATNKAIDQLLDYVTKYPNDGITYQDIDKVLDGHYDADYLNVKNSHGRAGAHIMLSEMSQFPIIMD